MASMSEYIQQTEANDGIRFSWNTWPASRVDAGQLIVPISCLYTPMKERENLPHIAYDPVVCTRCRGILNPFCQVCKACYHNLFVLSFGLASLFFSFRLIFGPNPGVVVCVLQETLFHLNMPA